MSPCTGTNCTSAVRSASDDALDSDQNISPEVIVTISFGIVMFLLALLALWQGHKQLHRVRSQGSRFDHWPDSHSTTIRRGAAGHSNTYYNVFFNHIESPNRAAPAEAHQHEPQMRLPAPPPPTYLGPTNIISSPDRFIEVTPNEEETGQRTVYR